MLISKEYLGKGWDFPFSFSSGGGVSTASYENKIKLNILVALSTAKGTRFMEPEFGSNLRQYVFEPDDQLTYVALKSEIINTINRLVPLVEVISVDVNFLGRQDNYVPIDIKYKIKATNTVNNLVYPYYKPVQTE